ncbi:hypothetical protein DFS34DRAFT_636441 [Phlyctochytrium arcticum]|nr:hypothetical protein DFS34DRAFT_636441 [Phlyctochytrium arcticum]
MDCCCAATGGRSTPDRIKMARVEYMAATSAMGIANTWNDGQTFTKAWCHSFQNLERQGQPFTVDNIRCEMEKMRELAPKLFVNLEGVDLPITFRPTASLQLPSPTPC